MAVLYVKGQFKALWDEGVFKIGARSLCACMIACWVLGEGVCLW